MRTCDLPPFKFQSVPQPQLETGASSSQLNEQQIEAYLKRFRDAVCADLEALDERITTLENAP